MRRLGVVAGELFALTTTISAQGIVQMSQASQARIRLCNDIVTLDGRHLARLRQFAAEMAR